jgi:HK97 family phage prohead protease
MTETEQISEAPAGDLRYRSSTVGDVHFPKRLIELVVMPYDEEALVEIDGRMVKESIAPGAFQGLERRANRIRVNRDHKLERTVGRALAFHPSRTEGLVAELQIAKTPLGDETLALADEDCLDASAGYKPMPGGETWLTRSNVRMTRCWLGHIAMTPDPAYESARVLSVRHAASGGVSDAAVTPNLDQVRAWLLEDKYREMEA